MGIHFTKMAASGNDFIVIDNRKSHLKNPKLITRKICQRNYGIGADGVLLIEKSRRAEIKMRILNADGSEAEMCGNGSRCAALFAHKKIGFSRRFMIETRAGLIGAEIKTWTVKVQLTDPTSYRSASNLKALGREVSYYFVNTGVPHAVIFEEDIEKVPVLELGGAIRRHDRFQPKGTNVDFVQVTGPKSIRVRTFERGVEAETLACGTGATASAIVAVLDGLVKLPVEVKTESGEVLKIDFQQEGFSVTNVTCEGSAQFIFEGVMSYDI